MGHPIDRPTRRHALGLVAAAFGSAALAGCGGGRRTWHAVDVTGIAPDLDFMMTRVADGRVVRATDYRGQLVLLYLGYTFCPDVCPATLSNLAGVLDRLGSDAAGIRVLFVTVDPNRDTPAELAAYVRGFGPQFGGLRGTPDQLERLARRYRLVYSVSPATKDHGYEVTHSAAIYVFDPAGRARLLLPSMAGANADLAGTAADLRRLAREAATLG